MKKGLRILIIAGLAVIIAVIIIYKNIPVKETYKETFTVSATDKLLMLNMDEPADSGDIQGEDTQLDTDDDQTNLQPEVPEKSIVSPSEPDIEVQTSDPDLSPSSVKKAEGNILATVNFHNISKSDLEEAFSKLPPQYRDMYKDNMDGFLEQIITKELLYQKAESEGHTSGLSENERAQHMDQAVNKLIMQIVSNIDIDRQEIEQFYEENKSNMKGASFEQVENDIRNYLLQQKKADYIEQYITELRYNADVKLNEKWINEQIAMKPKNPLSEALANGMVTVLDIGSSSCIPCKMMKPIFEQLGKELEGKANILLLEISDYRYIANEYRVRVIPTQIFFDQNGKQYFRHEGFMSKEDILKKLKETGTEL